MLTTTVGGLIYCMLHIFYSLSKKVNGRLAKGAWPYNDVLILHYSSNCLFFFSFEIFR